MKEFEEGAKAAQEIAKAVQGVTDLAAGVGRFVEKIVGPGAQEVGGILHDQARAFRMSNLVRLHKKFERILIERGLNEDELKHLPFGDAYRVIEAVSLEEDDSVQELWAELLASAMDPSQRVTIKKVYIELLKAMGPAEVALLDVLWKAENQGIMLTPADINAFVEKVTALAKETWRQFNAQDRNTAAQNLVRLRCIAIRPFAPNLGTLFANIPLEGASFSQQRDFALVNIKEFEKLIKHLEELSYVAAGIKDGKVRDQIPLIPAAGMMLFNNTVKLPELSYMLTAAGKDLLQACHQSVAEEPLTEAKEG